MKRMTLRNGVIVSVWVLTCFLSAVIVVTSCQKQRFDDELTLPQNVQSKAAEELPYLDFTENFNGNFDDPKEANSLILIEAVERAHFIQHEGLWQISADSAAQIRVSPRVFACLRQMIVLGNAAILESLETSSIIPRKRLLGEPQDIIEPSRSDCFASCVGFMAGKLGYSGVTYAGANAYVTKWYGSGIPHDQVLPNLQYFFGRDNASRFSMNNIGSYDSNLFRVMVLFNTGAGEGHAVMYWGSHSDSTYLVTDPQNENLPYPINKSDVIDAFQVLHNH